MWFNDVVFGGWGMLLLSAARGALREASSALVPAAGGALLLASDPGVGHECPWRPT